MVYNCGSYNHTYHHRQGLPIADHETLRRLHLQRNNKKPSLYLTYHMIITELL